MYGTYVFLREQTKKEYLERSFEDLVQEYRDTKDDAIIATVYCKIYGITKSCLGRYYSIPSEDRGQLALTTLVKVLMNYRIGSRLKFTSYYYMALNGKAQDLIAKENHKRDMLNPNCLSLEWLKESGFEAPDMNSEVYDYRDILENRNLRDSERRFCELVMFDSNNLNVTEIANELGMSRQGVYNMQKRLRDVFQDLLIKKN